MASIPKKVQKRFSQNIRKYIKILEVAKSRDINESDTVNIVNDILADVFGYDKYLDITSEYAIRGTYCDLAIKDGDDVRYLIECKAIGSNLNETHLNQAVSYASQAGIDWAVLTNGSNWEIYKVVFSKPVDKKLLYTLDFLNENYKDKKFQEKMYLLCKEAVKKSAMETFHKERKAINKHSIAAIIYSDDSLKLVRRVLKSVYKDINIESELIEEIIKNDIIKRDVITSEHTQEAEKRLKKNSNKKKRKSKPVSHRVKVDPKKDTKSSNEALRPVSKTMDEEKVESSEN